MATLRIAPTVGEMPQKNCGAGRRPVRRLPTAAKTNLKSEPVFLCKTCKDRGCIGRCRF
jgi:hypothetical protein